MAAAGNRVAVLALSLFAAQLVSSTPVRMAKLKASKTIYHFPKAESDIPVLVLGATGGCGKHVVRFLVRKSVHVKALVRSVKDAQQRLALELHIAGTRSQWLHLIEGDMGSVAALTESLDHGVEKVIIATGPRAKNAADSREVDYKGMRNLLQAIKAVGTVKRILLISSGLVTQPGALGNVLLNHMGSMVLGWKMQAEQLLRDSGVPYVIVRPMGLSDNKQGDAVPVLGQGDQFSMGTVDREVVARACVEALELAPSGVTFELKQQRSSEGGLGGFDWQGQLQQLSADAEPMLLTMEHHEDALQRFLSFAAVALVLAVGVLGLCLRNLARRLLAKKKK